MRLKCIKLAGFKSFVDPTTVSFPSNLCAIVGPNGCGKSNTIDAVRWVMGESSAKNLRGESLTDVIFNGSGGRKPVGQATIELVFDNSDGTLQGEYAGFSEISIKRKVTREAQNSYYLNGSKCRRRDITDIFLGTGLGPRSYAIIEQGMISKLIESKPDELRVFIEEAAGISKYKERRRDTENRMRRTLENLERLTDIRDELDRQLSRLERQSAAAEKYTEYKKEERQLKAQLQALNYQVLDIEAAAKQDVIAELELKVESFVSDQVSKDALIEKYRLQQTEQNDALNDVQQRFYAAGSDIARLEQSIAHAKDRTRQLQGDLEQVQGDCQSAERHLLEDSEKAEAWQEESLELEPELEMAQAAEEDAADNLQSAEDSMQSWQQEWDSFNQAAANPRQRAEVQQSRIQQLDQTQQRLLAQVSKLQGESQALSDNSTNDDVIVLTEQLAELDLVAQDKSVQLQLCTTELERLHEGRAVISGDLDRARGELQSMRGRHASLEALQQAALGEKTGEVQNWLERQGLQSHSRLADGLSVAGGWESAVETVLGNSIQAVCGVDIDSVGAVVSQLQQGELMLLDGGGDLVAGLSGVATNTDVQAESLLSKVESGDAAVASLLKNIYAVNDLPAALSARSQLALGESVITKEGIWLGRHWLRVCRDSDVSAGVIARRQALEVLADEIECAERSAGQLHDKLDTDRGKIKTLEQQREDWRRESEAQTRQYSDVRSQLSAKQAHIEHTKMRRERAESDIADAQEQLALERESLSEARLILSDAIELMEQDTQRREALQGMRDLRHTALETAKSRARQDKDKCQALTMRQQSLNAQLEGTKSGLMRAREQVQHLQTRRDSLQKQLLEHREPGDEQALKLASLLDKRLRLEEAVSSVRSGVEAVEQSLRSVEQARSHSEQSGQVIRAELEAARLELQTLAVQGRAVVQQLQEQGFELQPLLDALPEGVQESAMRSELVRLAGRISRLGAINLAAIEEYKVESERKCYLDMQDTDLRDALQTLENAIKRIDRETRSRFKETFERVNGGLQDLFPKVFGGGHAYLELTSDDMLDTGISIMARPPGKRNSTIHLLSGGEKALTAIALVFSIFQLNPAPFCMLDEVDAPLDDANVGRYARLVEEMSKQVQFIYITHNKIAMEMAHQLMGVTMHEPGVSRLVTVDVDEAAELAAM